MNPPVVIASFRTDFKGGLKFWCIYCNRNHLHGRGEGHRIAHCCNEDSPYLKSGYILKVEGFRR